jgi:hypothetical protein
MMSTTLLYRLAGAAAILAGVLRAIDAFAYRFLGSGEGEQLFLVTDIVLLFALIGLYAHRSRAIGWAGLAGFATAIVGIVLTRSAAGIIDAYLVGAAIVAVGVAVLGVAILSFRAFSRIGPILWIAALLVGILSWRIESDWLFEAAGVAFGLGFIAAGVELVRRPIAA